MPPSITIFIYTHHGIISAIGEEVEAVYRVRIEIGSVIYGDESANFRIVIAGFQIIQVRFRIIVISAVTEWIEVADMRCRCDVRSVCIQHCMVCPTIVLIFYHNIPVAVKNGLSYHIYS